MNKFNLLSFLLGAVAIWGIGVFALSSNYLKSDGTPNFEALKSTANDNRLNAQMRDSLMDGLTKINQKITNIETRLSILENKKENYSCKGTYTKTSLTYPKWWTPKCYHEREITVGYGWREAAIEKLICTPKPEYTTMENCEKAWFDWGVAKNPCDGVIKWTPSTTTHSCKELWTQNACASETWCLWTKD